MTSHQLPACHLMIHLLVRGPENDSQEEGRILTCVNSDLVVHIVAVVPHKPARQGGWGVCAGGWVDRAPGQGGVIVRVGTAAGDLKALPLEAGVIPCWQACAPCTHTQDSPL